MEWTTDEHGIGVNGVPQDDVVDLQLERIEVRLINLFSIPVRISEKLMRRLMHTLLQRTLYSKYTLCIVTSCSKE